MKARLLLFLALLVSQGFCATYYIDFVGGSDTNDGLSRSTPWKRHPYMKGSAIRYSRTVGDRFIFKGGVTWDSSCFPMVVSAGGSAQAGNDYYGADQAWYSGSAWSRPVWDGAYAVDVVVNIGSTQFVTFEQLEMRRVSSSSNWGFGIIAGGGSGNLLIKGCRLYGWRTTNARDDAHGGVIMAWNASTVDTIVIDSTEIENAENAPRYGGVCVRAVGTIRNGSRIHHSSSGVLFCLDFDGSQLYEISGVSFDTAYHTNGVYLDPVTLGKTEGFIRNAVFHDVSGGANMAYPNVRGGAKVWVYNNLFYGKQSDQLPIQIEPYQYGTEGPGDCYVFNCTVVNYKPNSPAVRVVNRGTQQKLRTLVLQNLHVIGEGAVVSDASTATVTNLTSANHVVQTTSDATAAGYTLANLYAPTASGAASPTTDRGTTVTPLPSSDAAKDLLGRPRPQGSAWDVGAYEFANTTVAPTRPTISVKVENP
jgi:hypothetical protein